MSMLCEGGTNADGTRITEVAAQTSDVLFGQEFHRDGTHNGVPSRECKKNGQAMIHHYPPERCTRHEHHFTRQTRSPIGRSIKEEDIIDVDAGTALDHTARLRTTYLIANPEKVDNFIQSMVHIGNVVDSLSLLRRHSYYYFNSK